MKNLKYVFFGLSLSLYILKPINAMTPQPSTHIEQATQTNQQYLTKDQIVSLFQQNLLAQEIQEGVRISTFKTYTQNLVAFNIIYKQPSHISEEDFLNKIYRALQCLLNSMNTLNDYRSFHATPYQEIPASTTAERPFTLAAKRPSAFKILGTRR